jgi:NUMOD4 motif./HNH endonuclease.
MQKRICDIVGYEKVRNCYFVSDDGKVISNATNPIYQIEENKELKQLKKTGGYLNVCLLCNDGSKKWCRVHRLVAGAFIENPHNKKQVNHLNENKQNNVVGNLEWVSAKENSRYTNSKGLYCYSLDGELVKHYKYAVDVIEDGFSSHAFNVARGIEKTHKKHYFSYEKLSKCEVLQRLSKSYPRSGRRK